MTLCVRIQIESLGDVVKEKDRQLEVIKERLLNIRKDANTNESALNAMEEALTEKVFVMTRFECCYVDQPCDFELCSFGFFKFLL